MYCTDVQFWTLWLYREISWERGSFVHHGDLHRVACRAVLSFDILYKGNLVFKPNVAVMTQTLCRISKQEWNLKYRGAGVTDSVATCSAVMSPTEDGEWVLAFEALLALFRPGNDASIHERSRRLNGITVLLVLLLFLSVVHNEERYS